MGRFGQPRYKDPVGMLPQWHLKVIISLGTPAALRGIREVTDKNKHILLEGIFNGDFIPDHLLPVGIHRCGQQRWRAHLCTVGHKFSGPPRDTVRDACEDRRKFCEENGVNFVLYGKQTHAKGPIGSRPIVPSTFPRLSDYVTSLSRASASGGGNSQAILSTLKSNGSLRPFFDAIENTKKIITAKIAERDGAASYVVTKSHAALHRKIVEDTIDRPVHSFLSMGAQRAKKTSSFRLCPISIEIGGANASFVWNIGWAKSDGALRAYLESIFDQSDSPDFKAPMDHLINEIIEKDVSNQLAVFARFNEVFEQLVVQHGSISDGIRFLHQHAPHVVHTRKAPATHVLGVDAQDPNIEIVLPNGVTVKWNVFTPDDATIDFVRDLENSDESMTSDDILFTILDRSMKHRLTLLQISPQGPKKLPVTKSTPVDDSHSKFTDADMEAMRNAWDEYLDDHLSTCASLLG